MKLKLLHPEALWISERRLIRDKFEDGRMGRYGHIADGLLLLPEGKNVAIEVELTMKGKCKLTDIFSDYQADYSINEVWYYCTSAIIDKVKIAAEIGFNIKVFPIESFLEK